MNDKYKKKIIALRGELGEKWLKELPEIIKRYESKSGIKVPEPFQLSYNYVAPAETQVVLKISFPKNNEFASEIEALKFFDGKASIKVLKEDLDQGAVLLEKAIPGERLRSISSDSKQISIASEVIKKLHKPIPGDLDRFTPSGWYSFTPTLWLQGPVLFFLQ